MKKKLTLLIALSTIIVVVCIVTSMITIPMKASDQEEVGENAAATSPATVVQTTSTTKATTATATTTQALEKYPEAAQIWKGLKSLGLNDYVCAGILGNIMAEVGGQTLNLSNWNHWSQGTHYGICQWGGGRKTRLLNSYGNGTSATLEQQIEFLKVEIFEEIPRDSEFYSMTNEKDAALYFAKYYERCHRNYYNIRTINATKALQYFQNK